MHCRTAQVVRLDIDPAQVAPSRPPVDRTDTDPAPAAPSSQSHNAAADSEVPWCGRSQELQDLLTTAEQGLSVSQLRCFLLLGGPGVGKSRLLREFGRLMVRHLGVPKERVLHASMPGEGASPTSVFAELIQKRCGITNNELAPSARDKLLRLSRTLLPAVRATEVAHLLGELLQIPFPDSPVAQPGQPGQRSEPRTFGAIKRFLSADARRAPLVLLLDEMEHATPETMTLLHYLLDGLYDLPVIIGVAARPEFVDTHPDFGTTLVTPKRLELLPLPTEDALELLGAVVGSDPEELPEPLLRHITDSADSSPRAVVELVRLLVETQVLSWVPASEHHDVSDASGGLNPSSVSNGDLLPQWQLSRLTEAELPGSFDGLVAARLLAMEPTVRRVLERASICGERFHLGAVQMLERCDSAQLGEPANESAAGHGDLDGPPLHGAVEHDPLSADALQQESLELVLSQLVGQGVVQLLPSSQVRGDHEYRFAYPPWQSTIYSGIDPALRRRYHHLMSQWLTLGPDAERQEVQESIARHLERAGRGSQATTHYRRAAELAIARGRATRAPRLLLRAIACLDPSELGHRLELWQALTEVMIKLGDLDGARQPCEKVIRLAYVLAARNRAASAQFVLGQLLRQKGDPGRATEHLSQALALFQQIGDQAGLADVLDELGQVLWQLGRTQEALDHIHRGLELRRRLGIRPRVAASLLHLGLIQMHRGQLDPALACFDEALRKADGEQAMLSAALEAQGMVALIRGDVQQARSRFEEALTLCEPLGKSPLLASILCHLGEALSVEGMLGEAESRLHQARELAHRLSDRRALSEIKRLLGVICLRRGDQPGALSYCQKALDQAQQTGLRHEISRALLSLGEAHAATLFDVSSEGEHPAWDCFRRAVALLREVGDEAELALALSALGRHLIERGRVGPGRATLREAMQLGIQLRMRLADDLQAVLSEL